MQAPDFNHNVSAVRQYQSIAELGRRTGDKTTVIITKYVVNKRTVVVTVDHEEEPVTVEDLYNVLQPHAKYNAEPQRCRGVSTSLHHYDDICVQSSSG